MSIDLLQQIKDTMSLLGRSPTGVHKVVPCSLTSITHMQFQQYMVVRHTFADDIQSLCYIFFGIIICYNDPLGRQRVDGMTFTYDNSILSAWTEQALNDLGHALDSKIAFLVDPKGMQLQKEISPYFATLFDLVNDWRRLHSRAHYMGEKVKFDEVAALLDEFIAVMPDDEKSPELETVALQLKEDSTTVTRAYSSWRHTQVDDPQGSKHLHDDIHSMDNTLLPHKQFKF